MSPDQIFDYAVIGAGIAGASVAYRLCSDGQASVIVLEREGQPGYHSTGRSAAMFIESYGTPTVQALTRASRDFYERPPEGFAEHSLLAPRSVLYMANAAQQDLLDSTFRDLSRIAPKVRRVGPDEALAQVPVLRAAGLRGAIIDGDAQDIDVHALHQGYLRGLRRHGGALRTHAESSRAERRRRPVGARSRGWTHGSRTHCGQRRRRLG